jgi:hypothetical protein
MTCNLRTSLLIVIYVIFSLNLTAIAENNTTANLTSLNANLTLPAKNVINCPDCHGSLLKSSGVNTGACSSCHESPHFDTVPSRYTDLPRKTIHSEHTTTKNGCQQCHSPPACNRCHAGHGTKETKDCVSCHGEIPTPYGHVNERAIFSAGSHNWMKCNNCHLSSNQFNFRDFVYPFNESYKLCSTCHSKQTKAHYQDANSNISICVNCHNPHSTSLKEQVHINIPISSMGSIITVITNFILGIFNLVIGNFVIFLIVLIFIGSIIAEYLKNRADSLRNKPEFVKLREKRELK